MVVEDCRLNRLVLAKHTLAAATTAAAAQNRYALRKSFIRKVKSYSLRQVRQNPKRATGQRS